MTADQGIYPDVIPTDLRLLPGVAGNLKTDGVTVESEWSSLLGTGCSSDWGALRGPEKIFLNGGTGGLGGSEASTGAFVIVD